MLERNYYNWAVSDLVSKIHKDIYALLKDNKISKIYLYQHKDVLQAGIPHATFNNDQGVISYQEVGEVCLCAYENINYLSKDCKFCGFTDGHYGDYFDVAEALPVIYAAICDIINAEDIKPNEME